MFHNQAFHVSKNEVIQYNYFKGTVHPKIKSKDIFPLTCNSIYTSRLFWCELPSFGDIVRKDVCFLSILMKQRGT